MSQYFASPRPLIRLKVVPRLSVTVLPSATLATQPEAIAGTNNTKAMTPLRTADAIKGYEYAVNGSALRDTVERFGDIFNVKDYGAVGDGSTNDAPAFQAALDAIKLAGGGVLTIPNGRYRIASTLTYTATTANLHSLAIVGASTYGTVLEFGGSVTNGITFTSTQTTDNAHPIFAVKNLSITTTKINSGTAIVATWANANNIQRPFCCEDVVICQETSKTSDSGANYGYWSKGIYVSNARNSSISDTYFMGEMNLSPQSSIAFELAGESTFFTFYNVLVLEATTGIYIGGTSEGIKIFQSSIVGVRYGVRHNIASGAEPELVLVGCDINAANVCVWTNNVHGVSIDACWFFACSWLDSGTWPSWTGVLLGGANSRYATILNCQFTKEDQRTGDTTVAVDFNAGGQYSIDNCRIYGFQAGNPLTYGIIVRTGVTDVHIGAGNRFENVTSQVANTGTRSIRQPIIQRGFATVASGDTITFPQAFNAQPMVVTTHLGANTAANVSNDTFTTTNFKVYHNAGGSIVVSWVAVGD